jgi:tRNA pseudouridine38-40 synthase
MRLIFVIEYDGSRFHGYQSQPNRLTVQDCFESALQRALGLFTRTWAAGRTDCGVHALGQVLACNTETRMPLAALETGLNARLAGHGIRIRRTLRGPEEFHPRHDAIRRAYRYVMTETLAPSVFLAPYVTFLRKPLDWTRVETAARLLQGEHNLISFTSRPVDAVRLERSVDSIVFSREGALIHADFTARSFLRGMIRNIMGWLIAIGEGRYPPETISELLATPVKDRAVEPAPPQGLYLVSVLYPPEVGL